VAVNLLLGFVSELTSGSGLNDTDAPAGATLMGSTSALRAPVLPIKVLLKFVGVIMVCVFSICDIPYPPYTNFSRGSCIIFIDTEGKRKAIVAIAAEVRGRGPGRIRMSVIPDVSSISLHEFVSNNVTKGAVIRTDGWKGYNGLETMGYKHIVTNISDSGDPAHIVMPRVHRVASLLDRWWLGIHQGAIRPTHLDYYLDEFTFRFNRRTSRARGLLFYRLMEQAVDCVPVSRKMIVGGHPLHIVGG
jgi:hypothetical protein